MTEQIRKMRWQLFGHILRLPKDTPPQYLMDRYMQLSATKKCKAGGQYWTLPRLINKEIKLVGRTFNSTTDLEEMRILAEDRTNWIDMRNKIERKWAKVEKVNELKRKMVISLTPKRTQRQEQEIEEGVIMQQSDDDTESEEEEEEEEEEPPEKRMRFIIRVQKRKIEAIIETVTNEEEIETTRLWKRNRQNPSIIRK